MKKGISTKTRERRDGMSDLPAKLKACDFEVQYYVSALEAENLKHRRKIAKLQAENLSLRNEIRILKEGGGEIKLVVQTPFYKRT